MTYQPTDARADRNTGCAQLQGLGRETVHHCVTEAPAGLEWGVGKQAFVSQDSCNGPNPCSEMLETLLLAVYFSMEVLIQCIKD